MTQNMISGSAPVHQFDAGPGEYEGRPPEDAATTEIAVRNAVESIGTLMREDRQRRRRDGLPDLVLPDGIAARAPGRRRTGKVPGMVARLRGFRPGPAHAAWAAAFGAVVVWPEAVLVAMFAGFVICLVAVALFGPEILERLRDAVLGGFRTRGRRRARRTDAPEMSDEMPGPCERLRDLRG